VKLSELEPHWIHPNVFVFHCPHCREVWLTCKNIAMKSQEQFDLFEKTFGDEWNMFVVPASESYAWNIQGSDFNSMSVSPSVDASASGHWHGHIMNGEVR
jgi:antirestriction protein